MSLHRIASVFLLIAAGCGGAQDSVESAEQPAEQPAVEPAPANPSAPQGQAVGTAKIVVTNGGASPLYFFPEGLEVGEPYIQTRALGQAWCGGQAYERRYMEITPVAPGATYEVTFRSVAAVQDATRGNCWQFEYVAARSYPARVCAYEQTQTGYASLGRPSTENVPKPTRCIDFTIEVPAAGRESVTKVTLPAK